MADAKKLYEKIHREKLSRSQDVDIVLRDPDERTGMGPLLILEVEREPDGRVEQWHFAKPYPVLSFAEVTRDDTGFSQIFIDGGSYSFTSGRFEAGRGREMRALDVGKTSGRLPTIVDRFRSTHGGRNPKEAWNTSVEAPKVVVPIGRLYAVTYDADKGDGVYPYRHPFEPHAQPLVCVDPTGKQLWLVGGRYTVTRHGIEDHRDD